MKKLLIGLTALSLIMTSLSQAQSSYCEEEFKTIEALKGEIDALEKQISWTKTNRNSSAVTAAIGTIATIYFLTIKYEGPGMAIASGSVGTVSGINALIAQNQVALLEDMIVIAKQNLNSKETEIRMGMCISESVKRSTNQKAKEAYQNLITINKALAQDIAELEKNLGNIGEDAATVVSIGGNIVLLGGIAGSHYRTGALSMLAGAVIVSAAQGLNSLSLTLSGYEARKLLAVAKKQYENLTAQEMLLRSLLN